MDRKLLQFLAVAELGNISLASDRLNVSQSTVSTNLKQLEQDHGVALFHRSSRGVMLTKEGDILYEHVRVMARLTNKREIRCWRHNWRRHRRFA